MNKNDITYEYRVFTHRLIDVESMEVGICTSKVIKEINPKDKINGRFFHTSDTDEWFFCWNDELQKLNLKGDSDVNAALEEVNRLIGEAHVAVEDAKNTASEAKDAATAAAIAADAATTAVESIENKADKSDVEAVSKAVENKADKSVVDALSVKVDGISLEGYATEEFVSNKIEEINIPTVPTKVSEFENDANYLTEHQDITGKQDVIGDLETIRSNAALGATALQSIPETYITEEKLSNKKFATTEYVEQQIANIEIPTVPTKVSEFENDANYLTEHQDISGKQDVITDLSDIRANAELAKTALQAIPDEYITETELDGMLNNSDVIKNINEQIASISKSIEDATTLTDTILNA